MTDREQQNRETIRREVARRAMIPEIYYERHPTPPAPSTPIVRRLLGRFTKPRSVTFDPAGPLTPWLVGIALAGWQAKRPAGAGPLTPDERDQVRALWRMGPASWTALATVWESHEQELREAAARYRAVPMWRRHGRMMFFAEYLAAGRPR